MKAELAQAKAEAKAEAEAKAKMEAKLAQAEGNAAVSELPALGEKVHAALRELYKAEIAEAIRGPY